MKMKMAAAAMMAALGASAAELTVMSTGAVKGPFTDASTQWSKDTGHTITATFDPAGPLRQKIASGVRGDIVIIPLENFEALEKDGVIVPGSRHDLGAVSLGAAVKQGAPVPDISTVDALKATLKNAKSVTYMDPERGTSGRYFDATVLPTLGIRDEVRAKTTFGEGGYIAEKVASGEIEIVFHNLTEIIPVKGVTILGPLPAQLQKPTIYSGAVMRDAKHPHEARELLDYLASPAGRKAFLDRGFTAP